MEELQLWIFHITTYFFIFVKCTSRTHFSSIACSSPSTLVDCAIFHEGLSSCTLKPKPYIYQPNCLENSSNLLKQSMRERLKWINNNGNTLKAFSKLETKNYVINETLVKEWENECATQCKITPFGEALLLTILVN